MTTIQETDMSLANLQRRVSVWSDYNFGSERTTTYRSLYGIIEEFGELVHSQLKMEQGIRGTTDEHMAKIKDAVGDLVFYLCDYLHMMNEQVDFDWPNKETLGDGTLFDIIGIIFDDVNKLVQHHRFPQPHRDTLWISNIIVMHLGLFCVRSGIDMREAVWATAEEVFQRDWRKFPKNGKTE